MRIRRLVLVALFAALIAPLSRGVTPSATAQSLVPYAVASESYYSVDTENGRMSVRVHGEYKNMQLKDLPTLPVYIMPGAENLVITAEDQTLETKITPGNESAGLAGIAVTTLPRPLKANLRITIDATYDVPPRSGGKLMTLEPGLIETPFIGQGPGSFVLVDVPEAGDNYLDPGCLRATQQPKEVKAAAKIRWVCGEVTIIAVNGDDPDVISRCAAMDDKCRQRGLETTFSAYMQSVTDLSKAGKLETDLALTDGRTVHMALKYFKRDQVWAEKQWAVAQKAFPMLESLFGWPYEYDTVTMRQSHHLEFLGAAGIALNGEVLLATDSGFDEEVTVHELAHMWASYNLDTKWLWEGLAEYATRALAPELGVNPIDRGWQSMPYKDPLATWYNGSNVYNSDYWYGKAGAFWFAYETAIGGRENMKAVLARMDDEPGLLPLDAGWFMDQGEWVGVKNLDSLFLEWVFNPLSAKPLLAERRAAHDLVITMQARAATLGLSGMPSDIYDNLLAWVFDPVADQVAKANKVLDAYAEVATLSAGAGLGQPDGVNAAWGNKRVAETLVVVEEQRQAINAIISSTTAIEGKPADSAPQQKLLQAREKYAAGDFAGAKSAAADAVTSAYNDVAASKMITIAKAKQAEFSPNFFGTIGMFFTDPDGDLTKAETALAAGDGKSALKLAKGSYETWDGATQRGIQRLAMVAGLMCALTFGVWFLLKRLEAPVITKRPGQGHVLEVDGDRRKGWRDWENS